jgi:hypothetical protein
MAVGVRATLSFTSGGRFVRADSGCVVSTAGADCPNLGDLPPGGELTITAVVFIERVPTTNAQLNVRGSTNEGTWFGNSDPIYSLRSLAVGASLDPAVDLGNEITATVVLTNTAGSSVRNVEVWYWPLPYSSYAFVRSSPRCTFHGSVVCLEGTVPVGAVVTETIVLRYVFSGGASARIDAFSSDGTRVTASTESSPSNVRFLSASASSAAFSDVGRELTLTASVRNDHATRIANDARLQAVLPASTTFLRASGSGCTYYPRSGYVECLEGDLAPSAQVTETVVVRPTHLGFVGLTTLARSSNLGDASAGANIYITPLRLSITAPASVPSGSEATLTITVTNTAAAPVTGVWVRSDFFRVNFDSLFVRASAGCDLSNPFFAFSVDCRVGTLAPGQTRTFVLVARVGSSSDFFTNLSSLYGGPAAVVSRVSTT